jgi:hypothetical protein
MRDYAALAPKESMRPRSLSGVGALNFTARPPMHEAAQVIG